MKMTARMLVFLLVATALSAADKIDLAKGQKHWAFQPVKKPALPTVKNKVWVKNSIDQFILARLEKAGLQPGEVTPTLVHCGALAGRKEV